MSKFTYWEYNSVRDPIASTIKKTFDRVSPSSMWGQIADECAEKIVNEIVDANRPGMWFEWINPKTVNEIQFICADPTRTDEPPRGQHKRGRARRRERAAALQGLRRALARGHRRNLLW